MSWPRTALLPSLLVLVSAGCDTVVDVDGRPTDDAGAARDAGAPDAGDADAPDDAGRENDAGGEPDAGSAPDAGSEPDAGGDPDAGSEADAGSESDAGVGGEADPWIGSGLWLPPGTTNRVIADQSGGPLHTQTFIPGCLNGGSSSCSACGCAFEGSYTAVPHGEAAPYTVSLGPGFVLGIRYAPKAGAGTTLKYVKVEGADGGNVIADLHIWLATDPAASFDATDARCRANNRTSPLLATGPGYCPLDENARYYLLVSADDSVAGSRYVVEEGFSDFL